MATFSIGATVELISGGPVMTVKGPSANSRVWCQWFAGKKLEQGEFPVDSLKHAAVPVKVPAPGSSGPTSQA